MADSPGYPGTPRWAKVFGIIAMVVILLFVVRVVTVGGEHARPSRSDVSGGRTAPSSVTDGHEPAKGRHR